MDVSNLIGHHASPVQWLAEGGILKREFEFPRKDAEGNSITLYMHILNRAQESSAHTSAHVRTLSELSKKNGSPVSGDPSVIAPSIYHANLAEELLLRAVCDDGGSAVFPDIATLRKCLIADEMDVLVTEYNITKHQLGPVKIGLSDKAVETWCKLIEEDAENAIPFYVQSQPMAQIQLLQCLANQLRNAQTGSSCSQNVSTELSKSTETKNA